MSGRRGRPRLPSLVMCMALLAAVPAASAPGARPPAARPPAARPPAARARAAAMTTSPVDFDPAGTGWNGLSYLIRTAREAQVDLRIDEALNWDEISADDVLFLVAPQVEPKGRGAELRRFVRAGGRLILADDFGAGGAWLAPFGMQLLGRPGEAARYAAGVRHLPELRGGAALGAFLGYHVERVVLNHPASLRTTNRGGWLHRALGRFKDGVQAWAVEAYRPRQQGKVLAVADPSILINTMTKRFYGNKQVAANLLRFYCFEGESCRVRLLTNLQSERGHFKPQGAQTEQKFELRRRLHRVFDGLNAWLARPDLAPLWWLLVILALTLSMPLGARLPRPRLPPPAADLQGEGRLRTAVQAWLARPDADYRRPARQLAQHLTSAVARANQSAAQDRFAVIGRLSDAARKQMPSLTQSVQALVVRGRLSASAGRRISGLAAMLEEVASQDGVVVDRAHFTHLATEVDWAEQVLHHTLEPLSSRPASPGSPWRNSDE